MTLKAIIDKYRQDANCQEIIRDLKKLRAKKTINDLVVVGLEHLGIEIIESREQEYRETLYHLIYYLYDLGYSYNQIARAVNKERTTIYSNIAKFRDLLHLDNLIKKSYENFTNYMENIYD